MTRQTTPPLEHHATPVPDRQCRQRPFGPRFDKRPDGRRLGTRQTPAKCRSPTASISRIGQATARPVRNTPRQIPRTTHDRLRLPRQPMAAGTPGRFDQLLPRHDLIGGDFDHATLPRTTQRRQRGDKLKSLAVSQPEHRHPVITVQPGRILQPGPQPIRRSAAANVTQVRTRFERRATQLTNTVARQATRRPQQPMASLGLSFGLRCLGILPSLRFRWLEQFHRPGRRHQPADDRPRLLTIHSHVRHAAGRVGLVRVDDLVDQRIE